MTLRNPFEVAKMIKRQKMALKQRTAVEKENMAIKAHSQRKKVTVPKINFTIDEEDKEPTS